MGFLWPHVLGVLCFLCCVLRTGAVLAEKPLLDDVVFGVASSSQTFCRRWQQFISIWWRPELNGVTLVDKMTPEVQTCLEEWRKKFPGLKVADAPTSPPEFGGWVDGGGERIIWSQIHILRQLFPNKRSVVTSLLATPGTIRCWLQ